LEDSLVKTNNTEIKEKLRKLRILLPEKTDEELMALLEIF
jgi:hypothetical protein